MATAGREKLLVGVVLLAYTGLALTAASGKALTPSEAHHLETGRRILSGDATQVETLTHPWQLWTALPLMASGSAAPPQGPDLLLCRAMALLPAVVLGVLVYAVARGLFGTAGGLISLTLFAFSPVILAHGPLATPDVFAAMLLTGAVILMWRWRPGRSVGQVVVSIVVIIFLLMAWASTLTGASLAPTAVVFMNGQWYARTPAAFHLYAVLIKTPLSVFLLFGCGVLGILMFDRTGLHRGRAAVVVAFLLAVLIGAVANSGPPGHRDVLALYPMMFILAGGAATWLRVKAYRPVRLLILVALLGFVAESFWMRPDYFAYFNIFAGGPQNGHKRLVDSSLDWGQDLPALKAFTDTIDIGDPRGEAIFVSYYGPSDPRSYGLDHVSLLSFESQTAPPRPMLVYPAGFYCISATHLMSTRGACAGPWNEQYEREFWETLALVSGAGPPGPGDFGGWRRSLYDRYDQLHFARLCAYLRRRGPDAMVGYSILVYMIEPKDIEDAQFGPLDPIPPGALARR